LRLTIPNENGRKQIFTIHTRQLAEHKRLSSDVSIDELASLTANYTGAEIAGVVKSAVSFTLNERINVRDLKKSIDVSNLVVQRHHFLLALNELKPAFGVDEDVLSRYYPRGICEFSSVFAEQKQQLEQYISTLAEREFSTLMTFLLVASSSCGLTALSTYLASHGEEMKMVFVLIFFKFSKMHINLQCLLLLLMTLIN
jgi:vesicle-fusing ATPase